MADVKKIATRESYGNALVACAEDKYGWLTPVNK